jgi:hypothetical protein
MAEITIRFRHNRTTGKKELVIHLESDSDVLSHEHEGDHRRLVEQLIGQKLDADTDVIIERIEKGAAAAPSPTAPTPVRQTVTEKG